MDFMYIEWDKSSLYLKQLAGISISHWEKSKFPNGI